MQLQRVSSRSGFAGVTMQALSHISIVRLTSAAFSTIDSDPSLEGPPDRPYTASYPSGRFQHVVLGHFTTAEEAALSYASQMASMGRR